MGKLVFFIVVWLIFFYIDFIGNPCLQKKPGVWPIIAFHHFIWTYGLLGWIFDDPVFLFLYLMMPLVAMLHWRTDRCFVNQVTEEYCGSEVEPFRRMDRIFGIPDYVYNVIVGMGVVIAAYKLYRNLKSKTPPKIGWGMKPSYLRKPLRVPTRMQFLFDK